MTFDLGALLLEPAFGTKNKTLGFAALQRRVLLFVPGAAGAIRLNRVCDRKNEDHAPSNVDRVVALPP